MYMSFSGLFLVSRFIYFCSSYFGIYTPEVDAFHLTWVWCYTFLVSLNLMYYYYYFLYFFLHSKVKVLLSHKSDNTVSRHTKTFSKNIVYIVKYCKWHKICKNIQNISMFLCESVTEVEKKKERKKERKKVLLCWCAAEILSYVL